MAVGLLTERENDVLRASLKHVYPVSDGAGFEHLLRALDEGAGRQGTTPTLSQPQFTPFLAR